MMYLAEITYQSAGIKITYHDGASTLEDCLERVKDDVLRHTSEHIKRYDIKITLSDSGAIFI